MSRWKVIFILQFLVRFVLAASIDQAIENTENGLQNQQINKTYWSGPYTLDVSNEAIVLALGHKLGLLTDDLRKELIDTIFLRLHSSGSGWSAYPKGTVDFDITLMTLKFLEYAGIARDDERVRGAWSFVYNQDKVIGIHALMHLVPMGLLNRELLPTVSVKILGVSDLYPLNFKNLGILQSFTVPFVTWNYFYSRSHGNAKSDIFSPIGFSSRALENFLRTSVVGDEEIWAQEGLRRILALQNPTGGWYALPFAFISMLSLWEAQQAGAGNFRDVILRSWKKILAWRSRSFEGFPIQQSTLSDIWDTASITYAFQDLGRNMDVSVNWLKSKAILFPQEKSRAWSFDSQDVTLPDLDDTAVVVQALASSAQNKNEDVKIAVREGVKWILDRQNSDGGFPAWTKGIPKKLFQLVRRFVKELPEVEDVSQMDITGRVLHMLAVAKKNKLIDDVGAATKKACRFLNQGGEGATGVPFAISHGHWFSNYFYSASMQLVGLVSGQCSGDIKDVIASWLLQQQNSDGGWGESNLSFAQNQPVKMDSTLSQTALVLVGLIEYYQQNRQNLGVRDSIARGIDFLMQKSKLGQDWFESNFSAVVVKNYLYNRYELVPAYAGLYVLRQWQKILTEF